MSNRTRLTVNRLEAMLKAVTFVLAGSVEETFGGTIEDDEMEAAACWIAEELNRRQRSAVVRRRTSSGVNDE